MPSATGRLMKNTPRQVQPLTSSPPMTGPLAAPIPPTEPHRPRARDRPARVGNAAWSSTSEDGTSAAAPAPCTNRAAISTPIDGASPQAAEASANSAVPPANTGRPPRRSASAPPVSSSPANDSVYASTVHCSPATPPCRSCPIDGSATLTTIASRMTRK